MPIFEIVSQPGDVTNPALVVAFGEWVDAGQAGTSAARHIAGGGEKVVVFDADAVYDYRSHRPVLDIVDGRPEQFALPEMTLTRRRLSERDLFVLTGPEPDYRWKELAGDVLRLCRDVGIVAHVSIGAIPTAVPHTAPTPVMMTASSKELMVGSPPTEGLLRVPAAAVSFIEWTNSRNGIPAVGFWAQVPHYASQFASGAVALVRRIEEHLAVTIDAGALEREAAAQRAALDQIFAGNPEAAEYLKRLEGLIAAEQPPSSENIAEEVERWLQSQRGDEPGPSPFSP